MEIHSVMNLNALQARARVKECECTTGQSLGQGM